MDPTLIPTKMRQDPVSTMQKTDWADYSSFLAASKSVQSMFCMH